MRSAACVTRNKSDRRRRSSRQTIRFRQQIMTDCLCIRLAEGLVAHWLARSFRMQIARSWCLIVSSGRCCHMRHSTFCRLVADRWASTDVHHSSCVRYMCCWGLVFASARRSASSYFADSLYNASNANQTHVTKKFSWQFLHLHIIKCYFPLQRQRI